MILPPYFDWMVLEPETMILDFRLGILDL